MMLKLIKKFIQKVKVFIETTIFNVETKAFLKAVNYKDQFFNISRDSLYSQSARTASLRNYKRMKPKVKARHLYLKDFNQYYKDFPFITRALLKLSTKVEVYYTKKYYSLLDQKSRETSKVWEHKENPKGWVYEVPTNHLERILYKPRKEE